MKVYVLYGSATGNAEHIAKDLAETLNDHSNGVESLFTGAECLEMDQFKRKKLMELWAAPPASQGWQKHAVVAICSTTGNGDAPENASRFVRFIKRATASGKSSSKPSSNSSSNSSSKPSGNSSGNGGAALEHVAFSVLGLGDTNYDQFCASGKLIDRKLGEMGGTRALPLAAADEATGLEATVEPWLHAVLPALEKACSAQSTNNPTYNPTNNPTNSPTDSPTSDPTSLPGSLPGSLPASLPGSLPAKSTTPLFVLYGSATGNAEHIAKDLAAAYERQSPDGFFPSVLCGPLNDFKKKYLALWDSPPAHKHGLILVCSTTGNGDAPENSDRFVRWLKRKTTPQAFQHCAFAVLGLGDTNYDQFCATGKLIDRRLEEIGGTRVIPLATADEATGLEEVVEPWKQTIINHITNACRGLPNDTSNNTQPTNLTETLTQTKVEKTLLSSPVSPLDSGEEKKTEEHPPQSSGTSTIRALLSLSPTDSLPLVSNSCLPALASSLSSCQLIDDSTRPCRPMDDTAENMTISSTSSGFHYTLKRPYESTLLKARYLTNTNVECAKRVSQLQKEGMNDDAIVRGKQMYEEAFPLDSKHDNRDIQCDKNGKRVIEMTLSLPDDFTLEYEPGDSVGLLVPNTPEATRFILDMLRQHHGILPTQKILVDADKEMTVEEAIRNTVDLCSPIKKKRLFQSLAEYATDEQERRALRLLASAETDGSCDLFQRYVEEQRRTVVDVLNEFPSCQGVPLERLLGCLPAIPPRYYSVCSSPLRDREDMDGHHYHLKVAFSVVDYLTPSLPEDPRSHRRIGGLATRYLECLCSPYLAQQPPTTKPTVQIFPKPTHDFRLPPTISTPLILIGPGTGIAPFLGFLSHRQSQIEALESTNAAKMASEGTWRGGFELDPEDLNISNSDTRGLNLAVDYMRKQNIGDIDVFFGCRYRDHDWLYRKEVEEFKERGIVSRSYVAFSREGKDKTYVQTIMTSDNECGERLVKMITEDNASIYICGDGNAMGKDVQETITLLLSQKKYGGGEKAKEEAMAYVDQMKKQGRFVLDIWS